MGTPAGLSSTSVPIAAAFGPDKDQLKKVEILVDGWKEHLNEDLGQYGSILQKIEVKEQEDLDHDVSVSRFGFVNAVLRRFCD